MKRCSPLPLAFLAAAIVVSAAEPAPPSRMYAAVAMTKAQKNSPTPLDSGLYVRDAAGKWTIFGPRILGVASLAASPVDPSVLLVSSADGVVRSTDNGKTWRKATGWDVGDVRCVVFDAGKPDLAYGATAWGPIRSKDGGQTWETAGRGLAKRYCQTILVDAAEHGRVILGTEDGVYYSTDGADSWRRAEFPAVSVLRLAQSARDARFLVAATEGRGVWLSRDAGATWSQADPASAKSNLYAAAVSPQDAAQVAVGGWEIGVRVSADGGRTWADRTAGLPVRNVFVLAFDPDVAGRLWVSTFEEGTFYSDDLGRTWRDGNLYGAYGSDFVFLPAAR